MSSNMHAQKGFTFVDTVRGRTNEWMSSWVASGSSAAVLLPTDTYIHTQDIDFKEDIQRYAMLKNEVLRFNGRSDAFL